MNNTVKKIRILKTFKVFFECQSIREAALKTGISKSSIHRYLHDQLALELLGSEVVEKARMQLEENTVTGNHRGGVNFLALYEKTRNEIGRFNGIKAKGSK